MVKGINEAVSAENAEKGARQSGGDVLADCGRPIGDGSHGIDDTEHGRDNADAWKRVADKLQDVYRSVRFLFLGHEFGMHEPFQLLGFDSAVDQWAQRIAKEPDALLVLEKGRIFLERAGSWPAQGRDLPAR